MGKDKLQGDDETELPSTSKGKGQKRSRSATKETNDPLPGKTKHRKLKSVVTKVFQQPNEGDDIELTSEQIQCNLNNACSASIHGELEENNVLRTRSKVINENIELNNESVNLMNMTQHKSIVDEQAEVQEPVSENEEFLSNDILVTVNVNEDEFVTDEEIDETEQLDYNDEPEQHNRDNDREQPDRFMNERIDSEIDFNFRATPVQTLYHAPNAQVTNHIPNMSNYASSRAE